MPPEPLINGINEVNCVKAHGLKTFMSKSELIQNDKWKIWNDKFSVNLHAKCKKSYLVQLSSLKRRKLEPTQSLLNNIFQTIHEPSAVTNKLFMSNDLEPVAGVSEKYLVNVSDTTNDFSVSNNPKPSDHFRRMTT